MKRRKTPHNHAIPWIVTQHLIADGRPTWQAQHNHHPPDAPPLAPTSLVINLFRGRASANMMMVGATGSGRAGAVRLWLWRLLQTDIRAIVLHGPSPRRWQDYCAFGEQVAVQGFTVTTRRATEGMPIPLPHLFLNHFHDLTAVEHNGPTLLHAIAEERQRDPQPWQSPPWVVVLDGWDDDEMMPLAPMLRDLVTCCGQLNVHLWMTRHTVPWGCVDLHLCWSLATWRILFRLTKQDAQALYQEGMLTDREQAWVARQTPGACLIERGGLVQAGMVCHSYQNHSEI